MKKIGVVSLFFVALLYCCFTYWMAPKDILVTFEDTACIKPHHTYRYLTCDTLLVNINGNILTIPAGFDTDLASIPHWLWSFISPQYSAFVYPSIMHDYLYGCPGRLTRDYIDDLFYSALLTEGVSHFTATQMYFAVRLFGQSHFSEGQNCEVN
jgi:hypothetical protein